jgi:hypothetical protein
VESQFLELELLSGYKMRAEIARKSPPEQSSKRPIGAGACGKLHSEPTKTLLPLNFIPLENYSCQSKKQPI